MGKTETVQETVSSVETLQAFATDALTKAGEYFEATEGFVGEQMPLLVQEIVWFEIASNGFWILLGSVMLGISARMLQLGVRHFRAHNGNEPPFLCLFAGFPLFIGSLMVLGNIMSFLKPLVAPRLFLVEYFRALAG